MQLISFHSLTAFLCVTGSVIVAGIVPQSIDQPPIHDRRDYAAHSLDYLPWSGAPTSALEAQIHFYMQPSAYSREPHRL